MTISNVENDKLNYEQNHSQTTLTSLAYTYDWFFKSSKSLLDDIIGHPLLTDYFNVYLSLPIFGQRILCHRRTPGYEIDPPSLLAKHQSTEKVCEAIKDWLIYCRLDNYVRTDIYIESLLCIFLTKVDDAIETSSSLHALIQSTDAFVTEGQFSTVVDIRDFYLFLGVTPGIKNWNFFMDAMRLLQARYSFQLTRLDRSYLNFLHTYYSQNEELRTITAGIKSSEIPDSAWFRMALNAIRPLRQYWIPRYLHQRIPWKKSSMDYTICNDIKPPSEGTIYSPSNRSIADYATDVNIELFYRILVSDSLAGSPFSQYVTQITTKSDVASLQTCISFIIDAEVLLSIPSSTLKNRIIRQFISRHLDMTTIDMLPNQIFDNAEEQRNQLIQELLKDNGNPDILLWTLSLKIIKILIPCFLNFIKFDRLRFLIQGKITNINLIIHDLRHLLPDVHFDRLTTYKEQHAQTDLQQVITKKSEIILGKHPIACNLDVVSSTNITYYTTEKEINTEERCEFRTSERPSRLTTDEIEQILHEHSTKFDSRHIETIFCKSLDTPKVTLQTNINTFIGDSWVHNESKQNLISDDDIHLSSIEAYTLDILNSARELFEVDRFVSNIIDESANRIHDSTSLRSTMSDQNSTSSSLSSIFEKNSTTDSSSAQMSVGSFSQDVNQNALQSFYSETELFTCERKILSFIGGYFINSPSCSFSDKDEKSELQNKTIQHEYLLINDKQVTTKKSKQSDEAIRFAPKDKGNEVKMTIMMDNKLSNFENEDEEKLLEFSQNQIHNNEWPLQEYIGIHGQRSWRALKLAADISNFDQNFLLNYHHDLDWISTDNNYGSFNQRTYVIVRNFQRRIAQHKHDSFE